MTGWCSWSDAVTPQLMWVSQLRICGRRSSLAYTVAAKLNMRPRPSEQFYKLGMHETVHVSELLEIPTVVASTDLLGIFPSSMGPLMVERLGLKVLPIPLELPPVPIYMIWHETRRHDIAHSWLREVVLEELGRFAPR